MISKLKFKVLIFQVEQRGSRSLRFGACPLNYQGITPNKTVILVPTNMRPQISQEIK
jgi:hypothetical protein